MNTAINTSFMIEEYSKSVANHDLTYDYSDDFGNYSRGRDSFLRIQELSKKIPKDIAISIWNEYVDRKILEGYRESYYCNWL